VNNSQNQTITWQCPSNLAIVKYWGKSGRQLPKNASLSMTLDAAKTITSLNWTNKENSGRVSIDFSFEGKPNPDFEKKMEKFLHSVSDEYFPFLNTLHLSINSKNTFPHSSGIASSASAMGALALCLCSLEKELVYPDMDDVSFFKKASLIARLGSGSASRSVYGNWVLWGNHPDVKNSSDEYAISVSENVHPIFQTLQNDIFIISAGEKAVSSSAGHQLMENNPFAPARYLQANQRITELIKSLEAGDFKTFTHIAEAEALTLHALMMCSEPSYTLLEPNSLEMVKRIKSFRNKSNLPLCFSFDAGPNLHLLYPEHIKIDIQDFINNELKPLCQNHLIIHDKTGNGPKQLTQYGI
jgi:diphosphomevalonate decarboxylase